MIDSLSLCFFNVVLSEICVQFDKTTSTRKTSILARKHPLRLKVILTHLLISSPKEFKSRLKPRFVHGVHPLKAGHPLLVIPSRESVAWGHFTKRFARGNDKKRESLNGPVLSGWPSRVLDLGGCSPYVVCDLFRLALKPTARKALRAGEAGGIKPWAHQPLRAGEAGGVKGKTIESRPSGWGSRRGNTRASRAQT